MLDVLLREMIVEQPDSQIKLLCRRKQLDLEPFFESIKPVLESGPTLMIYDVSYAHLIETLDERLQTYAVGISQLASASKLKRPCSPWCQGGNSHSCTKFGHSFCLSDSLRAVIYVGSGKPADNFLLSMNVPEFFTYNDDEGLQPHNRFKLLKKLSFLVEKVKNSAVFGLLVGTLSVERYLEAIEHIKRLLKRRKRKCFIISVGKPTVAKLSNFPEIDVFVMVSCNEGSYLDNKEVVVPIVTLLEIELAFNENRTWDDPISSDFSFLLQGGEGYVEAPFNVISEDLVETQLTSGFRSSMQCTDSSTEIALRSDMTVSTSGFSSQPRTWDGLELKMNDTVPSKAQEGRKGTAQGYSSETS
ncbi:hypothetical protein GE061_018745 [Apolygus lucorum]|uniref:Uncharacterized protein n=1 Tax=Apolygus lucorum TaxID=248454 RepID=A0A6A4JSV9_APOLU|nr:hypothetical protein GE061_018745 [Apolygus lucorum]